MKPKPIRHLRTQNRGFEQEATERTEIGKAGSLYHIPMEIRLPLIQVIFSFGSALCSLCFVYAFLLAGSLGAQSVYTPYTFTTLAGAASPGSADGTGSAARFNGPFGVATDSSGDVYVADTGNNTIRKITPAGVVTTLAGLAGITGSADGTGSTARFSDPDGVATDPSGNVYVADTFNHTIRKITPAGVVTTLAGLAGS